MLLIVIDRMLGAIVGLDEPHLRIPQDYSHEDPGLTKPALYYSTKPVTDYT